MAVTTTMYTTFITAALNKEVDWGSDTIKVALLDNGHTPDRDAHNYYDDISGDEVPNGSGYTTGGATLGSKTITPSGHTVQFDAANTSWTTSTITARYAVVYGDTGTPATSPLICYIDFGTDQSSSSGTFQITWDSTGVTVGTAS